MTDAVKIVGLMRFNIVFASAAADNWRATRGKSLEEACRRILDPKRIAQRLRLAGELPIASLAGQTDPDFELFVLISSLLPAQFKAEFAAMAAGHPFVRIREVDPYADLQAVCASLIPGDAPAITFRLDDDDAVSPFFIEDLRRMAKAENEECVLSAPNGIYMERRGGILAFQQVNYLKNAFGISFYSRRGKTIFDQGPHHGFDEASIKVIARPNAWLRSIHAGSDSNARLQTGSSCWTARPGRAAATMPEYRRINFDAVVSDLAPFGWLFLGRHFLRKQRQRMVRLSRRIKRYA